MSSSASIVICSHNQDSRLRLVLRALSVQSVAPREVIVVDDASTDSTPELAREAVSWFPGGVFRYERNGTNLGAPGARNQGARIARGELLLFLDSDALPTRRHVELHARAQEARGGAALIGPLWHTTTTEFLASPITGTLFDVPVPPDLRVRLDNHPEQMRITETDVLERFGDIVARSAPGTYPFLAFQEREADRIQDRIDRHPAAWLLMTPQNFSVPRAAFEEVSGFDRSLPFCEGWDLVLSLMEKGLRVWREPDAPIYHLFHFHPFAEFGQGLKRWRAVKMIAKKHRRPTLALALLFYRFQAQDPWIPEEAGPLDLDHLGELFLRSDFGPYDALLRGHPAFAEFEEALARQGGQR